MELDGDGELALGDVVVCGGLVEAGGAATVAADGERAEVNVDAVGVDGCAGVTDGGHEAAPIGIASCPCGLDEGRVSNGLRDLDGIGVGGCAFDVEFDDVRDAFSVGNNLASERCADLGEGGGERGIARADGNAAGSGGKQENGVVGGGVAVDGDAVEADLDGLAEIGVEDTRLDGRVREDVDEHGGMRDELRMNHAGAFAEGGDADFLWRAWGVFDKKVKERGFFDCVGGENGLGHGLKVVVVTAERGGERG